MQNTFIAYNRSVVNTIFLFLALICLDSAQAIVNIESMRVSEPDNGWGGSVDVGLNGEDGNSNKQSVRAAGKLNWRADEHSGFGLLSRHYGESNDVKDTDRLFAHIRYMYQYSPTFTPEVFTQYQNDTFKRLNDRVLLGGGLRIRVADESQTTANILGVGAFRSREKYSNAVVADERTENAWRLSLYWVFKANLNENVSLANTIYLQPDIDNADDLRALDQFALQVKISQALSLKLSVDITHDSEPPTLVDASSNLEETDVVYGTTFVYSF